MLERELERSRRYERSFALIQISGATRNGRVRYETAPIAAQLRRAVRQLDHVWGLDGSVVLLLPECGRTMAEALVVRLFHERPELVTGRSMRIVAFPEDGLTTGALLERLTDDAALPALPTASGNATNGGASAGRVVGEGTTTRRLVERVRAIHRRRSALEPTPDAPAAHGDAAAETPVLEPARERE